MYTGENKKVGVALRHKNDKLSHHPSLLISQLAGHYMSNIYSMPREQTANLNYISLPKDRFIGGLVSQSLSVGQEEVLNSTF